MEALPIHVYPADDAGEHFLHCDYPASRRGKPGKPHCRCACQPVVLDEGNDRYVIVHNSFDGREGLEWLDEILTGKPVFAL